MKRRTFVGGVFAGLASAAYAKTAPAVLTPAASAQCWLTDSQGRQLLPHGFITITSDQPLARLVMATGHSPPHGSDTLTGDQPGDLHYTLENYQRMAALGANFQVVQIYLGKIGGWPGHKMDPAYLDQLSEMVTLGKQVGMQSIIKLTIYDILPFGPAQWTQFWTDAATQKMLEEAWRAVFQHYQNEPAVLGYDLVNEPIRGNIESNEVFVRDYLVPTYRRLIDVLREISPKKWALYEPPLLEPRPPHEFHFGRMDVPIERARIAYAPHYYGHEPALAIERYLPEAALSQAALLMGEHGNPTTEAEDFDLEKQWDYQKVFIATATAFDQHALGAFRAFFCGTRFYIGPQKATWAVLEGKSDASGPERKYVMDGFARPRPLVMAGQALSYSFNFATREFSMQFVPDSSRGESEVYVPRCRHFPDGFRLIYSRGLTLAYDPSEPTGMRVVQNLNKLDASAYRWQPSGERILVREWGGGTGEATLRIVPGLVD